MDPVLEIRNLSLGFLTPRGTVHALRDVSLTVPEKKIVGIVGESGSGKSTILWSIMGLLAGNARITGGEIMFGDRDLLNLSEDELRAVRGELRRRRSERSPHFSTPDPVVRRRTVGTGHRSRI